MPSERQLIYFADPMCSWCWGFAPVMERIISAFAGRLNLHLIMGGLRAGNTRVMDDRQKAVIREHWTHVADRSGQPFDWSLFEREDFVYDTEPSCRAVVTARNMSADKAFPMMNGIQAAFYAEGRDVTTADVLADVADAVGLHAGVFRDAFDSDKAREMTRRDIATAQQVGVRGFPTVLLGDDGVQLSVITNGYQPFDTVAARLERALDGAEAGA